MSRTFLRYVLLFSLWIAGCGLQPLTPELINSNLPALDGEWTISMNHSGGIMGLSRSIKISSDRIYTITDERANKTFTGELTADELSKLKEQVSSATYIPPTQPDGMGCADCFIYDLRIQGNGEIFSVQLNDISLSNSGLEGLVTYLRRLIDLAMK